MTTLHTIFFYIFSTVLLVAAFRVITARNPVHAVIYLVVTFFQAAAIWLLLKAEFLAVVLVLCVAMGGFAALAQGPEYEMISRTREYLADGTPVTVDDRPAAIIGRVSMDMLTVDLTDLPDTGIGSRVELWGRQVPVNRVAQAAGTIAYELLCNVKRVRFSYSD